MGERDLAGEYGIVAGNIGRRVGSSMLQLDLETPPKLVEIHRTPVNAKPAADVESLGFGETRRSCHFDHTPSGANRRLAFVSPRAGAARKQSGTGAPPRRPPA